MYSKEIYKQLELVKEVLALSALMANNPTNKFLFRKSEQRLKDIAFPEMVDLSNITKQRKLDDEL